MLFWEFSFTRLRCRRDYGDSIDRGKHQPQLAAADSGTLRESLFSGSRELRAQSAKTMIGFEQHAQAALVVVQRLYVVLIQFDRNALHDLLER